ncbi:hypothetical protein ACFXGA_00470 [Actinosynnema sp. NPDC059335]|uniref:hypothetical protein n=1 Tax=Actinosynnema sp. NPDC059335 TaxID=3346804 RepID=UPI00366EA111
MKNTDTDSDSGCVPAWGEHADFTDTGERGFDKKIGKPFQVWVCQCGAKTLNVFPHLKKK